MKFQKHNHQNVHIADDLQNNFGTSLFFFEKSHGNYVCSLSASGY